MIRYNSSVGVQDIEAYINGAWTTLTTGGGSASIYLGTSAATPDPARNGEPTTGLFTPASGDVSVSSLGSEIVRFTGTGLSIGTTYVSTAAPLNGLLVQGNVGIGTTSPQGTLDVEGGTAASGNGQSIYITAQNGASGSTGGSIYLLAGTSATSGRGSVQIVGYNSGKTIINLGSTGGQGLFQVDDSNSVVQTQFNGGGAGYTLKQFGIGSSTTPQSKLDVFGNVSLGSYAGTNAAPSNGMIVSGNVGIGTSVPGSALAVNGGAVFGTYANNATAAPSNGLIVSGQVGIGTTSPVASLDLRAETDAIALPVGATGQEPASPVNGMIRYNSSVGVQDLEAYVNGAWTTLTTGSNVGTASIYLGTSAATPDPARNGEPTTGLFTPASGDVSVSSLGSEIVRFTGTGLSIGTTYVATAAPSNGLLVQGNVGIGTSNPGALFTVGSNAFEVNSSGTVLAGTWNGNTVTVPYGGTGATSLAVHGVVVGEGTSTVNVVPVGTSGYVLTSNGVSADPTFTQLNLGSGGFAGVLPVTSGGTGTTTPAIHARTALCSRVRVVCTPRTTASSSGTTPPTVWVSAP